MSYCDRKFYQVKRNFSLYRKFLLWHKVTYTKCLSWLRSFFCFHEIFAIWHPSDIKIIKNMHELFVISLNRNKNVRFQLDFRGHGFMARFLPPCLLKSHPDMQGLSTGALFLLPLSNFVTNSFEAKFDMEFGCIHLII